MDRDAHKLLALTSIRRLWELRHSERDGAEARKSIHGWVRDLRALTSH